MSDRMTLAEILARGVSTEWYEGVALVRSVTARLLETSGETSLVPELNQIEMSESGHVTVTGRTIASEPVRYLGQLLQATLGSTQVPVQLRLLIVQATATSAFGSIREYDEALGFFERPGRETVLQGLYAKAAVAAPVSKFEGPRTLNAVAPLTATEPPKTAHKRAMAAKSPAMKIAIAVMLVVIGAAGAWYASRLVVAGDTRDVSAIARQASDAVGVALLSSLSAVTERTGLGRLVPAAAAIGERPATPDTSSAKPSRIKRSAPTVNPAAEPNVVLDADPFSDSGRAVAESTDHVSAPSSAVAAEAAAEHGGPIFSQDSEDVSPPVGIRPQMPRELPPDVRPEQLARVELIVSETGTVESVKLLGTPRSVHDSMFLSAVKAWHFQPALKDGQPVRFRQTVWRASE